MNADATRRTVCTNPMTKMDLDACKRLWKRHKICSPDIRYSFDIHFSVARKILEAHNLTLVEPLLDQMPSKRQDFVDDLGKHEIERIIHALDEGLDNNHWEPFLNLDIVVPVARASQPTSRSWEAPFRGIGVELLKGHIKKYFNKNDGQNLYANMCAIIQSSGTGKSRLVDEYGKKNFLIPVNLTNGASGFPPPDIQVRDYLTAPVNGYDRARRRCVGFLLGLFRQTLVILQDAEETSSKEELVTWFHEKMSTPPENNQFRKEFFTDVLRIAKDGHSKTTKVDTKPAESTMTLDEYNQSLGEETLQKTAVMRPRKTMTERLYSAVEELTVFLRNRKRSEGRISRDVEVTIAFDDTHVLCERTYGDPTNVEPEWSMLTVLCDSIRCLYCTSVWGLFISTSASLPLAQASPHRGVGSSHRITEERYKTVPPFTVLGYDLSATKLCLMKDGTMRVGCDVPNPDHSQPKKMKSDFQELTLNQVTSTEFICHFGRPLFALMWQHGDQDVRAKILHLAMTKLVCGEPGSFSLNKHSDLPINVMFACLAQRLCLEFNSTGRNLDEETQIAAHMRLCLNISPDNQATVSSSGSEPLLAEAAAAFMSMENFMPAESLKHVLSEFSINKGDRGEMVALLAVTVARDLAAHKRLAHIGVSPPYTGLLPNNEQDQPLFRAVKVIEFLSELFELDDYMKAALEEDFPDAYIYFNHFIKPFTQSTCTLEFLLQYMTRGAAVLCANNTPGIDFLFGVLHNSMSGIELRVDRMSGVYVHVKNNIEVKFHDDFQDIKDSMGSGISEMLEKANVGLPIIRIVFSLGSPAGLHYSNDTITLKDGTCIQTHDFWCGGIGTHFVPRKSEPDATWQALADATMKMKEIFSEKAGLNKSVEERKSLTPGASSQRDFWQWIDTSTESTGPVPEDLLDTRPYSEWAATCAGQSIGDAL